MDNVADIYGLRDYGDDYWVEGLRVTVKAFEKQRDIPFIGRIIMTKAIERLLANRLDEVDLLKHHGSEIHKRKYPKEDFVITGLPRTGSTSLHCLMAVNPVTRAPMYYEAEHLRKPNFEGNWGDDPRIEESNQNIDKYLMIAPEFAGIHNPCSIQPEEDFYFLKTTFWDSMLFFYGEGFVNAFFESDIVPHLKDLKERLSILAWQNPCSTTGKVAQFWTRKNPQFASYLWPLKQVWPNCRIIFTHRNVKNVVPSLASLVEHYYKTLHGYVDLHKIGNLTLQACKSSVEAMELWKSETDEFYYDVRFKDFVTDPIAKVKDIYAAFGEEVSEDFIERMKLHLSAEKKKKKERHSYTLQRYGLTEDIIDTYFASYHKKYAL
eukprot:CAMPEP_0174272822 /NCGR_PEP_ID=MMETSP0439-20130205/52528_1 /TAXON_ID=0 /ORGANISM="Stereomyxa ramosa, Strain Chinc5" /LENGTH=377 /DNA_ID=CAMNT_0015363615 /DNA_START=213 /DNA_END=1346 /DNA_ORIENTATION=-